MLSPFSSAADAVEARYTEHLFDKTLGMLPDRPVFVFNATNMQTGRSFRFTKAYMGIGGWASFATPRCRSPARLLRRPPFHRFSRR
jgi:hypothetical protein